MDAQPRPIRGHLATKLLIPFIIIAVMSLVGAASAVWYSYNVQRVFAGQLQQEIAKQAAERINTSLAQIQLNLEDGTRHLSVEDEAAADAGDHHAAGNETYRSALLYTKDLSPVFYQLSFIDTDGHEIEKLTGFKSVDHQDLGHVADEEYFQRALQGEIYISPAYISEFGFPFATFALPVYNQSQQIVGVLAAEADVSQMWSDITYIANQNLTCPASLGAGETNCPLTIYVVDAQGNLIAINNDTERVMGSPNLSQPGPEADGLTDLPILAVQEFVSGRNVTGEYQGVKDSSGRQVDVIGTTRTIPLTGWGVIVERPVSAATQQSRIFSIGFILLLLTIIAVISVIVYYVFTQVIRPLDQLRTGVQAISSGQLEHAIEIHTGDELELLGREFNVMSIALNNAQESLADAVKENKDLLQEETRRSEELMLINSINQTTMASLDVATTIDAVLRNLQSLLPFTAAEINLWDGYNDTHTAFAVGNTSYTHAAGDNYTMNQGLTGWIATRKSPLFFGSAAEMPAGITPKNPNAFNFQAFMGVPLQDAEGYLGTLELVHLTPHQFTENDIVSLTQLAKQAALAIKHAQLFEETRRQSDIQEKLAAIATMAGSTLELNELIERIMRQTVNVIDAEQGLVWLYDERKSAFSIHAPSAIGVADNILRRMNAAVQAINLAETVTADGNIFHCSDVNDNQKVNANYRQAFQHLPNLRNIIVVPLSTSDEQLGEIHLYNQPDEINSNALTFLTSVAYYFATALKNARLYQQTDAQLARRVQELDGLQRVSQELNSTLDLDAVINRVIAEAVQATTADFGNITLYADDRKTLTTMAHIGWEGGDNQPDFHKGIIGRVLRRNQSEIVDDVSQDPEYIPYPIETRSEMAVPIQYSGEVEGVINLESTELAAFNPQQMQYVQALADQAALAIRNARDYKTRIQERQEARSRVTQLTRLSEITRAFRANQPLDVILEDIAYAIEETGGFNVVTLSVVEKDQLKTVTGAGIPLPELHALQNKPQSLETLQANMQRAIKISDSYFQAAATPPGSDINAWQEDDQLFTPLLNANHEIVGLLTVKNPTDGQRPTSNAVDILELFANQAATAIENNHLFAEVSHQTSRLKLSSQISARINAILDPAELMADIVTRIAGTFGYYFVQVYQVDPENADDLILAQGQGIAHKPLQGNEPRRLRINQNSIVGTVAKQQQAMLVNNVFESQRYNPDTDLPDTLSEMAAPVVVSNELLGVLDVHHNEYNAFTSNDLENLQTLADQLGVAIRNAQLVQRLNKFNDELEQRVETRTTELRVERDRLDTLNKLSTELARSLEMQPVLYKALGIIGEALKVSQGSILLAEDDKEFLTYRAAYGRTRMLPPQGKLSRYKNGVGLAGKILEQEDPVIVPDLTNDKDWIPDEKASKHRAALGIRLSTGMETLGVLLLFHKSPNYFTESHSRLLEATAPIITTAINNAHLYNLIQDQVSRQSNLLSEVRAEANKNQAIVEGIADGVLVIDHAQNIQLINRAAQKLLNTPDKGNLEGTSLHTLRVQNPLSLEDRLGNRIYRIINEQIPRVKKLTADGETRPTRIDEDHRVVTVQSSAVSLAETEPESILVVLRDITKETESERLMTEFVSTVSHELRTPMTSIKGYTDLLSSEKVGNLSPMQEKFVQVIKSNADRLTALVNDILEISRVDTGRVKLELEYIDLAVHIENVVLSFQQQLDEKALSLETDLQPELPPVFADSNRLTQILFNLIGNAVKYTHHGDKIVVTGLAQTDGFARVEVQDTGLGLAPDDAARVFDRFFRAERDQDSLVDGTGLGLPITKMFVELMGGEIWLTSQLGQGSTFSFTMPLTDPAEIEAQLVDSLQWQSQSEETSAYQNHSANNKAVDGQVEKLSQVEQPH